MSGLVQNCVQPACDTELVNQQRRKLNSLEERIVVTRKSIGVNIQPWV